MERGGYCNESSDKNGSIQPQKGIAQLSAAKTCSKVNATLFEEIKFNACQIAFIPRSLDNEPLRMRYTGSCGSTRLRHELPCNQHTTSALIVKSFRGINARSLVTICLEVNATELIKNPAIFRK